MEKFNTPEGEIHKWTHFILFNQKVHFAFVLIFIDDFILETTQDLIYINIFNTESVFVSLRSNKYLSLFFSWNIRKYFQSCVVHISWCVTTTAILVTDSLILNHMVQQAQVFSRWCRLKILQNRC